MEQADRNLLENTKFSVGGLALRVQQNYEEADFKNTDFDSFCVAMACAEVLQKYAEKVHACVSAMTLVRMGIVNERPIQNLKALQTVDVEYNLAGTLVVPAALKKLGGSVETFSILPQKQQELYELQAQYASELQATFHNVI